MAILSSALIIGSAGAQDLPDAPRFGSPEVPIDSWVYPAFDRLAATGIIQTQFLGMRPWTRFACAMLVREANEHLNLTDGSLDAELVARLRGEFGREYEVLDEGSIKQVQ